MDFDCNCVSHLEYRHFKIKVKNAMSTERSLLCPVPQGSVLGPILFFLYVRTLSNIFMKDDL